MPRLDSPCSLLLPRSRPRPPRPAKLTTALLLSSALSLSVLAWLSVVFFSSRPPCWHAIQKWPGSPLAFPWDPSQNALPSSPAPRLWPPANATSYADLSLGNLVFGIAGSAQLWAKRKEFVKLWWKPREMRGFVWLEESVQAVEEDAGLLPQVLVSQDVTGFRYTHSTGHPSGVRIARIIQEMFKLDLIGVRWFIMGDDDTVFAPDNLVRVLKKYNPNEMYYIGHPSESHSANTYFSHGMAFGGGGIAISYPLAEALSGMLDECLERYPFLFGSDDRLHACITELGVPLTKETGFHQFDVHGNAFGLLAAHPIAPFVSMHHLDEVDPVFPNLDALGAMQRLVNAMQTEPSSFLQRCICYDRDQRLSFSISLGYTVQVFPYIVFPRDLERPEITFKAWNHKDSRGEFDFDTRSLKSVCRKAFVFFLEDINIEESGAIVSTYKRDKSVDDSKRQSFCFSRVFPPEVVEQVRVVSRPMTDQWFLVPRRQCCKLMGVKRKELEIIVGPCKLGTATST